MDLIVSIGATHSRCALIDQRGRQLAPESFDTGDYSGVVDLIAAYLANRRDSDCPVNAAIAVPGEVDGDRVDIPQHRWTFLCSEVQAQLDLRLLRVRSDFDTLLWGLTDYRPSRGEQIGDGIPVAGGTIAALSIGNELSVGGLVAGAEGWATIHGFGGRACFAPPIGILTDVAKRIAEKRGHCLISSIVSATGLVNIYQTLSEVAGRGTPTVLVEDVTALAQRGEPLASKTVAVFFAALASVAANFALTLGATGGVYLSGTVTQQLAAAIKQSTFREYFVGRTPQANHLANIPTFVIDRPIELTVLGLRRLLGTRGLEQ